MTFILKPTRMFVTVSALVLGIFAVSAEAQNMHSYPNIIVPMGMPGPFMAPHGFQPTPMIDPRGYPLFRGTPMAGGPYHMHHMSPNVGRQKHRPSPSPLTQTVNTQIVGPIAGGAVTGGLAAFGVPKPVAGWAGSRVNANAAAIHRERNGVDQGVRLLTGVSARDIRERGILGGDNSEARRLVENPVGYIADGLGKLGDLF